MGLVKGDDPVEVLAEPGDDLVEAGLAGTPRRLAKGRVGGEQDAAIEPDAFALLPARQRHDVVGAAADGAPVAPGVLQQGVIARKPDRACAPLAHVVGDDGGDLTPLAAAGAVAKEESASERNAVLSIIANERHLMGRLAEAEPAGQEGRMGLAGVDHRLRLGVGDPALV